ncbi:unnamed protein product, partial [Choristocarpus tenellus]
TSEGAKYVLSAVDHLTRFAILVGIANKQEKNGAEALVNRIFSTFGPPETLHSDQGKEFKNKLLAELRKVYGYHKTTTTAYRPQGNTNNTAYNTTVQETPFFLMFGTQSIWGGGAVYTRVSIWTKTRKSALTLSIRHTLNLGTRPILPIDLILGVPEATPITVQEYSTKTVENLQLAYELAQRNIGEMVLGNESKNVNHKFPLYGTRMLSVTSQTTYFSSCTEQKKLLPPWRGPYEVKARITPVVYRVKRLEDQREVTVHLARLKPYKEGTATEP